MLPEMTKIAAEKARKRRMNFKAALTVRLMMCGKTQKALADEIGISENSMSAKSNNYENFTVGELNRIADRLHTSASALLDETKR